MTLSDLYRKVKGFCSCLNSADVPLKCNGKDFNVDFELKSKDCIVSHVEVKQDLALTWEDIGKIHAQLEDVFKETAKGLHDEWTVMDMYEEVSKRFNEQRKI